MRSVTDQSDTTPEADVVGFAIIPNWMTRDPSVTPTMTRVYVAIAGRCGRYGSWEMSHQQIGTDCGLSGRTVQRALGALRALGVIDWEAPTDPTRGCAYRLTTPSPGHQCHTPPDTSVVPPQTPVSDTPGHQRPTPEEPLEEPLEEGDSVARPATASIEDLGKRRRKAPEHPLPDDWKPNPKHAAFARERNLDLSTEAMKFRNHAAMRDRRCVRWDAAFQNWLINAEQYARRDGRAAPEPLEGWALIPAPPPRDEGEVATPEQKRQIRAELGILEPPLGYRARRA